MLRIYSNYKLLNEKSEIVMLYGLLENLKYIELDCNHLNKSKFDGVIEYCNNNFIYVNEPSICDIFIYPGFKLDDEEFQKLNELSKKYNKKILCFYNSDDDKQYQLESNIILFRTSFYKSTKLLNEYAMPVWGPNYFDNTFIENDNISIGYCGHRKYERAKYLNYFLEQKEFKTDFIIRDKVWTNITTKQAQIDYFNNLKNNMFIFCNRGAGNYSYRFYEILMMGRIPILINTDCVYPFEENYNLSNHCVYIEEKNIKKMYQINMKIREFIKKNNLIQIQKSNRKLWEDYFSPCKFMDNVKKIIYG